MKQKQLMVFIVSLIISAFGSDAVSQEGIYDNQKQFESFYNYLETKIDRERIRSGVFYLAKDPLPRRVLNWSRPGQTVSTLEEADAWIIQQLKDHGYNPKTDETMVRAFGRDFSKPLSKQYAPPPENAPWYTARNIIAERKGSEKPEQLIIILAHKDSQSWIASPGANDNAVGTSGALELAIVLSEYNPKHTIQIIFCNEEHTPWTSITAANNIKSAGLDALAVINIDGIGVKSPEAKGTFINVTRYVTPEGKRLAGLMGLLNEQLNIGLDQSELYSERPADDEGSFLKAGFPWAVRNAGSMPNADPFYHTEEDVAENVDIENAKLSLKLTLAAILYLDIYGRP